MATELNSADQRVLYFYGVTQSAARKPLRQAGVDLSSPIEAVECEGIICWVSRVSAQDFETSLPKNMENLDWLATASVAHQRVIGALARDTEILPARLGTVFRDDASLRAHVREHLRELKKDFARVKDSDEWGVKVFEGSPVPVAIPKVRSGKEYLAAKAALLPRRQNSSLTNGDLSEFQAALKRVAQETATAGRISGGQRGLLFQTSLLIKRHKQPQLQSILKKFSTQWGKARRIECTGPWPPYSFVSQDKKPQ